MLGRRVTCHVSQEAHLNVCGGDITYPAGYPLNKLIRTGTAFIYTQFGPKQRYSLPNLTKIRSIQAAVTPTLFLFEASPFFWKWEEDDDEEENNKEEKIKTWYLSNFFPSSRYFEILRIHCFFYVHFTSSSFN